MERTLTLATLFIVALLLFIKSDNQRIYTTSDAEGYFLYLPALTIYGFDDVPVITQQQFHRSEVTGRYYDKYTAGVAIMEAPFYGMACILAGVDTLYQIDGYSRPFQRMVLFGAMFYAFFGLGMLYFFLRKKYSIGISGIVIISIFMGTNMYYYTMREPGMSHVYSFFLWTLLFWQTEKIYKAPDWKNFIFLSVIISLLVFIRPTNIIASLVILLWNMNDWRVRWEYFKTHFRKFIILPVPLLIFAAGQLFLWMHMHGSFVAFSYNEEPGFIYLLKPKVLNVLFHVHNGLLIYAPILIFSLLGLVMGIEKRVANFRLITIILLLFTYVFGSWWAWWFGGAYGHRCYVDLLPLFGIVMAYFLDVLKRSSFDTLKGITGAVMIFLIYYSVRMTEIYASPWDGPGFMWPQFWENVGRAICGG